MNMFSHEIEIRMNYFITLYKPNIGRLIGNIHNFKYQMLKCYLNSKRSFGIYMTSK